MVKMLPQTPKIYSHRPYSFRCIPDRCAFPSFCVIVNGKKRDNIPVGEELVLETTPGQTHHCFMASSNCNFQLEVKVRDSTSSIKTFNLGSRGTPVSFRLKAKSSSMIIRVRRRREFTSNEEKGLLKAVLKVLGDDDFSPRQGAIPSETLKSFARRVNRRCYDSTLSDTYTWEEFLANHKSHLTTFTYSETEIRNRGLKFTPDQKHVVRSRGMKSKKAICRIKPRSCSFSGRAALALAMEGETHGITLFQLANRIQLFRDVSSLSRRISASYSTLMRILQKHSETFRWSTDPAQKTVIGIKRFKCFSCDG